jgi:hypothetical protein
MTFEVNQYYSYNNRIYSFNGETKFASGYTLYYFEDVETQELLILTPDEISEVTAY